MNISVVLHCNLTKSETYSRSIGGKKANTMWYTETRPVVWSTSGQRLFLAMANMPSLKHQLACLWFSWAHRSTAACAIVFLAKHRSISPLLWFTIQGLRPWIECCIQHLWPLLSLGARYTRHLSQNTPYTGIAILIQEKEVTLRKSGPSAPIFLNVFKRIGCSLTAPAPLAVKKPLINGIADEGEKKAAKELNIDITLAAKWAVKLSEMSRRNRKNRITGWMVLEKILRPSHPSPLLRLGQPEQVAQVCVRLGFEYLQGWRLQDYSVPIFGHPHSQKVFSCVQTGFHIFVTICAHCFLYNMWAPYTPEQPASPRWRLHVTRLNPNLSCHLWNPLTYSLYPCWSLSPSYLAAFAWRPVSACWTSGLTASHLLEMLWHHPRAQYN